jgi:hypothetical protein
MEPGRAAKQPGKAAGACSRAGPDTDDAAASWQGLGHKGGPGGYIGWLSVGWVRKIIRFWQKHSPNCNFWYFIVFPPYPLPKTNDRWVRREGKTDPIWVRKVFNCLRSL